MAASIKKGQSQPLKWFGGKANLADWIISKMAPHELYREPFFGGGAVLLRKDPDNIGEVVNDLHHHLTLFWEVLQSTEMFKRFKRKVQTTPFSDRAFTAAKRYDLDKFIPPKFKVDQAVAFFIRYRMSRQGLGKDYATPTARLRRGMNENVSAWLSAVDGLPEAHARMRRVEIRCMDALYFIRIYDNPHALFYCDPPYLHETRHDGSTNAYEHEMTEDQHRDLLETLTTIKGKFLLSGYPSKLYDSYRRRYKWGYAEKQIDNKASGKKVKERKTECLWSNYKMPA